MDFDAVNYFTCTLGEAAKHNLTSPEYDNISTFLDHQAEHVPNTKAVGFFKPGFGRPWSTRVFTFRELRDISLNVATALKEHRSISTSKTIALLCPSSEEFLFIWLALIRLDIAVLLLAPQCQPDAIRHLCSSCGAHTVLYHPSYKQLANDTAAAIGSDQESDALKVESTKDLLFDEVPSALLSGTSVEPSSLHLIQSKASRKDVAYIHHTSGTSSGLPKPIFQAHSAAVTALPKICSDKHRATFTTTPLYHGGIADCFRSWTSAGMIWLYPAKDVPITVPNINSALKAVAEAENGTSDHSPELGYFSSVPYVLQLLEEDDEGLSWLRKMDVVGVGGASLPDEVGNRLVKKGVKLASRYGSSECGFMMSSHRDYDKDDAWPYLRDNVGSKFLRFEPREDGLSELVVLPTWPHRAKTNREDGSFATADLFEPHSSIPNAWRYHSRADSQLTLITGKKFDPAPLEGALADVPVVSDALIFGNGQPYPGVLLFRTEQAKDVTDQELINTVWIVLQQLNASSQDHARIAKDMVKPMPWQIEPLQKSSKGTLIRSKAEARFADAIEAAYKEKPAKAREHVPDQDVQAQILEIFKATLGRSEGLNENTDLFAYGVDSVAAMRIRGQLQAFLAKDKKLPITVVEGCGTIKNISNLIVDMRAGKTSTSGHDEDLDFMVKLVEEYSHFSDRLPSQIANGNVANTNETVVLTGATGALGAHVLNLCMNSPQVRKVISLIRGEDEHAARARLDKASEGRMLAPLSSNEVELEVLPAKLGDTKLGLSDDAYERLARQTTMILHLAWEVNFRMNLRNFRSNSIASVTNLINLALASPHATPPRLAFCSSVASVINRHGGIPEKCSNNPEDASPLGYSRSKWVAEQICKRAAEQTRLKGHLSILRVGQLSGDTKTGVWNEKEAWPMMLSTVKLVKALPEIQHEPLNWLPVDIAAQTFLEAVVERTAASSEEVEVIHVLNQRQETKWMDLLAWLRKEVDFEIVSPPIWIGMLEERQASGVEHPAFRLIGLWKENLCKEASGVQSNEAVDSAPHFETLHSVRAAPVLADIKPVEEEYFMKIWKWIDSTL